MFQPKIVEKIKTHILFLITFFPENRVVYEIMWKNTVEPGRPQMTICQYGYKHILRICNPYFLSTTTMVRKRGSMLRYTFIACLVHTQFSTQYP